MDLEPGTMDSVRSGPFGQIFRPGSDVFPRVPGLPLAGRRYRFNGTPSPQDHAEKVAALKDPPDVLDVAIVGGGMLLVAREGTPPKGTTAWAPPPKPSDDGSGAKQREMAGDDDGAPCPGPGPVIGRVLQAPKLREFTLAELWAATRGFKLEMVLGEGGFGGVYCAMHPPHLAYIDGENQDAINLIFELITTLYQVTSFHFTIGNLAKGALGESKKSDNALMNVKIDDQKLAIGTLSVDKNPHIQFDLVFDKEFELSHTSKTTSVFFTGYKVEQPFEEDGYPFLALN
uniref:Nucleoplasmin-like domain-containing protein n=1 Tax=Zea mays TaxID=4577 RepID=A0A804M9R6_MAIZE